MAKQEEDIEDAIADRLDDEQVGGPDPECAAAVAHTTEAIFLTTGALGVLLLRVGAYATGGMLGACSRGK